MTGSGIPVTVVIPVHNRRDLVAEAVKSVLSQTRENLELIVVDDGSTDGTADRVEELSADPRLKVIRTENLGVSAARNRGVAEGAGRYVSFLDSDDLWEPGKLERQVSALAENPGAAAVYTGETWIRNGRFANPCLHHAKYGGDIFFECLPLCIISPSSVMIRREIFEELGGFDQSLPACEDYDLWLRLSARHQILYLEERLIIKRNGHEGQLSRAHFGLDRFRVRALWKIALDPGITPEKRAGALEWIIKKSLVVAAGAKKRVELERAEIFGLSALNAEKMLETFSLEAPIEVCRDKNHI